MNHRLSGFSRHPAIFAVTTVAFGGGVAAFQGKVGLLMIKQTLAKPNNIGVTSLVFGVALTALTGNG